MVQYNGTVECCGALSFELVALCCGRKLCVIYVTDCDRPGLRFQPGPGSNFLARAGGIDCGRSRGFLVKIWSPVRLAEVMKLFEN